MSANGALDLAELERRVGSVETSIAELKAQVTSVQRGQDTLQRGQEQLHKDIREQVRTDTITLRDLSQIAVEAREAKTAATRRGGIVGALTGGLMAAIIEAAKGLFGG